MTKIQKKLIISVNRFVLIYINFQSANIAYITKIVAWLTWLFRCIRTIQYSRPIYNGSPCKFHTDYKFHILLNQFSLDFRRFRILIKTFSNWVLILLVAGARLQNNVIKESQTYSEIECSYLCLSEHPLCKSINYEVKDTMCSGSTHKCQLNNATKSLQLKHFVKDEAFNYFEMIQVLIIYTVYIYIYIYIYIQRERERERERERLL